MLRGKRLEIWGNRQPECSVQVLGPEFIVTDVSGNGSTDLPETSVRNSETRKKKCTE
jgi:hypothetical protein